MKGQRKREKNLRLDLSFTTTLLPRQLSIFNDNRDNSDNGKNGRNVLCHEVTYNWDNKITVANSFISASTRKLLVKLVNRTESLFREKLCIPYLVLSVIKIQRVPAKKVSVDAHNRVGVILS